MSNITESTITNDIPNLVFKSVCLFNMNPTKVFLFKFNY